MLQWALAPLHGLHRPHEALRIYREVYEQGNLREVPVIDPVPPTPMPNGGIYQLEPWDGDGPFDGTFNPLLALSEPGGCIAHRTLSDGRVVQNLNESPAFDVDAEGAVDLLSFELDRLCGRSGDEPVSAYLTYAQYGTISVHPKHMGEIDRMVRRARWKHRNGLDLDMDREVLLARVKALAQEYQARRGTGDAMPRRLQLELLGG